jgi:SAM-dependent methyltransferase
VSSDRSAIERRIDPILCDPLTGEAMVACGDSFRSPSATYPVVHGIPRFVASDQYVRSFSYEWSTHPRTQLDAFRGDSSSEAEFVAKTGFNADALVGRLVLDAGIGAGRYTDIASRWGADVVGIDLSYAVEAAHASFRDRTNIWIAQADINDLPFKAASFDIIFSIGVLHHTPDTKRYFMKLVRLLKPGGTIAVWVYPPEDSYVVRRNWLPFVNKIPPKMFYSWCSWFVPWLQARAHTRLGGIIRKAFPISDRGLGIEWDVLDTFDGYSPRYHWLHSPDEVIGWFQEAGLQNIRRPSSWNTCVRGDAPGPSFAQSY